MKFISDCANNGNFRAAGQSKRGLNAEMLRTRRNAERAVLTIRIHSFSYACLCGLGVFAFNPRPWMIEPLDIARPNRQTSCVKTQVSWSALRHHPSRSSPRSIKQIVRRSYAGNAKAGR